ncbi:hypothetical protein TNCV_4475751 [Trichonephila clavipes]|nr:hypothetical protein TNCV_4475751 [Trichonephila clavipes]
MLYVDNPDKFVLLCRGLDLEAHGPDWADNHKWSFENGRKFVISLLRPVVQYEISSLEGMGSSSHLRWSSNLCLFCKCVSYTLFAASALAKVKRSS